MRSACAVVLGLAPNKRARRMAAGAFFERGRYLGTRLFGRSGSVFEAPAFVAGLDDIAVMSEAIEQCRCHFGVVKNVRPFAEGEIGSDDDRGSLIEAADEVEEQLAPDWANGR